MANLCGCLHGGHCIDPVDRICACQPGFEGGRCEQTYLAFTHKDNESENNMVLIIVITGLVLCIMCFVGAVAWRKYKSTTKKRKSVLEHSCNGHEMINLTGKVIDDNVVLIPDEGADLKALKRDAERQCRRYIVICLDNKLPNQLGGLPCSDKRSDSAVLSLENGQGLDDELPERKRRRGVSF